MIIYGACHFKDLGYVFLMFLSYLMHLIDLAQQGLYNTYSSTDICTLITGSSDNPPMIGKIVKMQSTTRVIWESVVVLKIRTSHPL